MAEEGRSKQQAGGEWRGWWGEIFTGKREGTREQLGALGRGQAGKPL